MVALGESEVNSDYAAKVVANLRTISLLGSTAVALLHMLAMWH